MPNRGADVAAGGWLAGGLFRPQPVIPLVLLMAVRRWRVLLGFLPVAIVLTSISAAVVGGAGLMAYVQFVLRIERTGAGGFGPQDVPNLRGIVGEPLGPHGFGLFSAILLLALSLAVFAGAWRRICQGRDSTTYAFCLASVAAILVSFHALSHDLTLILPLVLLCSRPIPARKEGKGYAYAERLTLLVLFFLTPLYVYLLLRADRFFWFGLTFSGFIPGCCVCARP